MVKVKNKRELKWCLEKHAADKISATYAAKHLKITPRRFKQLYAKYKKTNTPPTIEQNLGRPKKQIQPQTIEIIKQAYQTDHLNAAYLRKIIYARQKIKISHRTIHEVLLNLGYAHPQPNKQKRRAPWIRYERKHSLSLIHTDWHYNANGKYLCTMLDDASRKVIAAGEFEAETTQNALIVLEQARRACLEWYSIKAVLSDHGTQFVANKKDSKGHVEHCFGLYLKKHHMRHILCRVKHPQTNGKSDCAKTIFSTYQYTINSHMERINTQ